MNVKKLFRGIGFLTVAVLLTTFISMGLQRKTLTGPWNYMAKMNEFYSLEKNSLDYVCLGSSHAYCTVNPLEIWNESGLKGFTLATQEQPLVASYHYLVEAFKTQSPKVVFLEGFMGYTDYKEEAGLYAAADPMRFSLNKLKMIHRMVPKGQRENYYFNVLKYHSRWKDVTASEVNDALNQPCDFYKGYAAVQGSKTYGNLTVDYGSVAAAELPEKNLWAMEKIRALTEREGAELVLLLAPFGERTNVLAGMKAMREWAEANGVRVVDLAVNADELGLAPEDYYDSSHLDVSGAAKASRYLAEVLEEYGLSPRTDPQWDKDFQAYREAQP